MSRYSGVKQDIGNPSAGLGQAGARCADALNVTSWLLFAVVILAAWLAGCAPKLQPGPVDVARVVDGDTVWITQGSAVVFKLRLIGIDTPEKGYFDDDTGEWVFRPQCYALEATARLKEILATCAPVFVADQGKDVGAWGRPLGSLLCDGKSVALQLIEEGYAREFTYHGEDYADRAQHIEAEKQARLAGRGGWSECPGFDKRRASHRPVEGE